jgi:plastocyanin
MTKTLRTTFLGSALLALAACAGGSTATPAATVGPTVAVTDPAAAPVSVTLRDFKIEPSTLTGTGSMTINVKSDGPTPHNFTVRDTADAVIGASKDLRTGESDTVVLTALTPGEYTFFCAFAGHESLGMRGTLTITE